MATISLRSLATAVFTRGLVLAAASVAAGCSLDKAMAPSEIGPSGPALSVVLTATPDILPRNGEAMSEIKVTVYDAQGAPKGGQRLMLLANAGTLSLGEVVTGSGGEASVTYIAPGANVGVSEAVISVLPVGSNFDNIAPRSVAIGLLGPTIPVPSFTFAPAAPARFAEVTFDASASTLGQGPCGSACTYSWAFGAEATATGQVAQYRFQNQSAYTVTLTVTSAATGTSASTIRTVIVGAPAAPTAAFTSSPTTPGAGDTVFFNASESTGANGAAIVEYRWIFGNGTTATATTPLTSRVFATNGTYRVQLTVVDENDQTATVEEEITIAP
jgi:chitodextrinase